ncbi:uncharacterized protein LOC120353932 [Nilaparvata lugens]|uniref:uncharacterized protein LOC120353932 n=1 Tax=Nilaparvata lugens TaxID=108931 RepID=UPI00193E1F45|nr:uncharacterized protein LOC120353932 [Nilaparvata lugens]
MEGDQERNEFSSEDHTYIELDIFDSFFVDSVTTVRASINTPDISAMQFLNAMPRPETTFLLCPVSYEEGLDVVSKLKNSESKDFFDLSVNLIKRVTIPILVPLTFCLNSCIVEGVFPALLKIAKTVPIHKKGPIDLPGNFRPIAILPVFSKNECKKECCIRNWKL